MQLKWCRIIKLEFCVFIFGETTPFDSASSFLFFFFFFIEMVSFETDLAKKKKKKTCQHDDVSLNNKN